MNSLVEEGEEVIVIDNFSTGKKQFIEKNISKIKVFEADIVEDNIEEYFRGVDMVWHLAANPDVRILDSDVHIKQNIIATKKVLDAMVKNNINKILFTSSSTVYGIAISGKKIRPIKETHATQPISFYGAAKLSSEAIIHAYCSIYGLKSIVFRLANVIGPNSTHGVIFDFIKKLEKNPNELEILGDGNQTKSYIYVDDCTEAMMMLNKKCKKKFDIFNVGNNDWINVKEIAQIVCEKSKLNPRFKFTGGSGGWKGDVPLMLLSIDKIKKLGFSPRYTSREAVEKTTEALLCL